VRCVPKGGRAQKKGQNQHLFDIVSFMIGWSDPLAQLDFVDEDVERNPPSKGRKLTPS
jgi:hypothetical protein